LFTCAARLDAARRGGFDAVMLTSANAARLAGDAMASFTALPCYAVGEASAAAAADAGFADIRVGPSDGAACWR
jgi:uroporphyrinogen-III synthase